VFSLLNKKKGLRRMNNKIKKMAVIAAVLLLTGCTGAETTQEGGIVLTNELSSDRMQPGGSVLLRTSVNNFFDNELQGAEAKLVRSFGQLTVDGTNKRQVGEVQANPNATARTQWTLNVKQSASSGTTFTNKVRLCFHYNQTAWHELVLVNSFEIESQINSGTETGPLAVSFSGLEMSYIQNEQIDSKVPISISIKNNYDGFVGTIDMSRDEIANITYVEMRVYDASDNASPEHFEVMTDFTNPSCGANDFGCFNCNDDLWNEEEGYITCYANNLSVFGDETFLGTKLNIIRLETEELIELVEVMISYDYCIESDDFTLEVFTPGGN